MADKKKRVRRKKKMTIPLAFAAGFIPPVRVLVKENTIDGALLQASRIFLGFDSSDGRWVGFAGLKYGTVPIALGFAIHQIATMVGVNRALSRSGVPFIRI